MNHPTEEQLIAYHDGEAAGRDEIVAHLKDCGACRGELERIEALLRALNDFPVPDPGEDYELRVWQRLAPKLPEKRTSWWQLWLEPRSLVTAGALAVVVLGRYL